MKLSWLGDGGVDPLHPFSGNGDLVVVKLDNAEPLHLHSGAFDLVVVKLDSGGELQWHTFYGSGADDQAEGIALTADRSIYVTGFDYAGWQGDGGQEPIHR